MGVYESFRVGKPSPNRSLLSKRGNALVISKKSKLPLDAIMQYEKKGGWGRSIKGAHKAVEKLSRSQETQCDAMELSRHIDLALNARALQPSNLASVMPDKLKSILTSLMQAKVTIHGSVQMNLVKKAGDEICGKLQREADTAQHTRTFCKLMSPWRASGSKEEGFDPLNPCMSLADVPEREKSIAFWKLAIRSFVVPHVLEGEQKHKMVLAFIGEVSQHLSSVDLLDVNGNDAEQISEFLELASGFNALFGSADAFLEHKDEVAAIKNHFSAHGSSPLVLVSNAMGATKFYKEQIDMLMQSSAILMEMQPKAKAVLAKLGGSGADLIDSIVEACSVLVNYSDLAPAGTLDELKIKTKTSVREALAAATQRIGSNLGMAAMSAEVTRCSNMAHELTLAFPMEDWAHDIQAEVGEFGRQHADEAFNNNMAEAMRAMGQHLVAGGTPPPDSEVDSMQSLLAEAKLGKHFLRPEMQDAMRDLLKGCVTDGLNRLGPQWHGTLRLMLDLMPFALDFAGLPGLKYQVKALNVAADLQHATETCNNLGQNLADDWAEHTKQLIRLQLKLRDTLADQPADQTARAEVQREMDEQGWITKFDELRAASVNSLAALADIVKVQMDREVEETSKDLTAVAGGDPSMLGKSWLGDTPVSEWSDWEQLLSHAKDTLLKSSPKALKTKLTQAETLLREIRLHNEVFSGNLNVDIARLWALLQAGCVTKATGTIIRTLSKNPDKDAARNVIRAELTGLRDKFGQDFDVKPLLPTALAKEIDNIVAMKRKR